MIPRETSSRLIAQFWQDVCSALVKEHKREAQSAWRQINFYRAELDLHGSHSLIYHLGPADVALGISRGRYDVPETQARVG